MPNQVLDVLPTLVAVLVGLGILWLADWLLLRRRPELGSGAKIPRQLVLLALTGLLIVIVILTLPIGEGTRNQLLGLLGLAITAVIALSSTTFIANAMAGLMLRSVKNFKPGDFISVEDHFGRVTERGLFHTELQTEDRSLTPLPNLYLMSQPVSVMRASGTIVSTSLSLGYDVAHARVEPVLLDAARATELTDPFVQVTELGNYAVTYRVAGFLDDVRRILTVRSNLRRNVLDALHGSGIEIVSPAFMNQRQLTPGERVIPSAQEPSSPAHGEGAGPESLVFDKAEAAGRLEHLREARAELEEELGQLKDAKDSDADAAAGQRRLARQEAQLTALERQIQALETELTKRDGSES